MVDIPHAFNTKLVYRGILKIERKDYAAPFFQYAIAVSVDSPLYMSLEPFSFAIQQRYTFDQYSSVELSSTYGCQYFQFSDMRLYKLK